MAHADENILGKVRGGELAADQDTVSLVLESLDRIKEITGILETTEAEPEGNDSDLVDRLNAWAERGVGATAKDAAPSAEQDSDSDAAVVTVEDPPGPEQVTLAEPEGQAASTKSPER